VIPLLAALGALLFHAVVDFNLHTPPAALLLVLLASGMRMRGVAGNFWVVEFRYHKVYGVVVFIIATVLMGLAARPVAGFWYYLRGTARPQNLFREKWALEEARRDLPPLPEALTYLQRAVKVDFPCAPYHSNLGGAYFQSYFQGEGGEQTLEEAFYHAHLAAQLNPNNYRYPVDLAQAMTSLYRTLQPERSFLREAVEHYRRAMALAPRNYTIYEELGLLYDELEEHATAEEMLREAVRLEPNYLRGWYNLGIFYARRGLKEKARRAYLRGATSARQGWRASVTNAYEHALVDFDPELFEDSLMQLEIVEPVSKDL
jgi:tetratricopeptide (TPR) repeat protein